jgi:MFS family permease
MDRHYAKNIRLYFIYTLLGALSFSRAIFIVYLASKGFSSTQAGMLESTMFIAMFIMDIPTSIIGDTLGRKWTIFAGCVCLALYRTGMILCTSFPAFLGIFALLGVSSALTSGVDKSLLYESLKECGREGEYLKMNSRVSAINSCALGMSIVAGGFMQKISWDLVNGAGAVTAAAAALCALLMRETPHEQNHESGQTHKSLAATAAGLKIFCASGEGRKMIWFFVAYALFEAIATPFHIMSQQLWSVTFHMTPSVMGLLSGGMFVFAAIACLASNRIGRAFSFKNVALTMLISSSAVMASTLSGNLYASIFALTYVYTVPEMFFVFSEDYIQQRIPSRTRASVLSVWSTTQTIFIAISYTLLGWLMDHAGIAKALGIYGVLVIVPVLMFAHYFASQGEPAKTPPRQPA